MSSKKQQQLGMNPSTAQARLTRDILWSLVQQTNQDVCCKCNNEMSRETFSIEHVTPWLDSEDPAGLFFDLSNIKYSHLRCNISDARVGKKKYDSHEDARLAHLHHKKERERKNYCPERRRERYRNTGN